MPMTSALQTCKRACALLLLLSLFFSTPSTALSAQEPELLGSPFGPKSYCTLEGLVVNQSGRVFAVASSFNGKHVYAYTFLKNQNRWRRLGARLNAGLTFGTYFGVLRVAVDSQGRLFVLVVGGNNKRVIRWFNDGAWETLELQPGEDDIIINDICIDSQDTPMAMVRVARLTGQVHRYQGGNWTQVGGNIPSTPTKMACGERPGGSKVIYGTSTGSEIRTFVFLDEKLMNGTLDISHDSDNEVFLSIEIDRHGFPSILRGPKGGRRGIKKVGKTVVSRYRPASNAWVEYVCPPSYDQNFAIMKTGNLPIVSKKRKRAKTAEIFALQRRPRPSSFVPLVENATVTQNTRFAAPLLASHKRFLYFGLMYDGQIEVRRVLVS